MTQYRSTHALEPDAHLLLEKESVIEGQAVRPGTRMGGGELGARDRGRDPKC